jgi:hypothetical protein
MLDDITGTREAHHYPEHKSPIVMTVYTKSPEKWLLIDRETGQAYQGSAHGDWDKLVPKINPAKKKDAAQDE